MGKGVRRIDDRRRANREENVTSPTGLECFVECVHRQCFTEPDHIRSQSAAAARTTWWHFAAIDLVLNDSVLFKALRACDVSMQLDHPFASSAVMEAIDILSDQA